MPADNAQPIGDIDIVVAAAMTLLASEENWTIDTAALALGRSPEWLRLELAKATDNPFQHS